MVSLILSPKMSESELTEFKNFLAGRGLQLWAGRGLQPSPQRFIELKRRRSLNVWEQVANLFPQKKFQPSKA
jgi:hypothetical protein